MAPEILYTSKQLTKKFEDKRTAEAPDNPKFSDEFLKIHRAIRWLGRAEKESDDPDAAFIFQWIAFNAAYARDISGKRVEIREFLTFIRRIVCVDKENVIENCVIPKTRQTIMDLVENQYVFGDFWRYYNGDSSLANWNYKLTKNIKRTRCQFERGDTAGILTTLFIRLYVLRNQLVHGGATWNSNANRSQVKDGARIMGILVPVFINLMMDNHKMFCGKPYYPLVGYPPGADG